MQVKKDDIKEKILNSAHREFLDHGFAEASLRIIAEKAGVTKGAVYSYFKNKDELFCELTAPAIRFIENEYQHDQYCDATKYKDALFGSDEVTIQGFQRYVQAVFNHYDSFKLLLFCASGSSLRDYKERIIHLYAHGFHKFLSFAAEKEGRTVVISEMFVHTLATTYVSFLEELVLHEPNRKEANDYAAQMAVFIRSGFEKLYWHQLK